MISFIVPAYNEENSIADSIYSINKAISAVKSIDKHEIIILNDGSDDSTEKKILELQKIFKV
jgi:glycosyltransferase involved in cell wall biosynthesis